HRLAADKKEVRIYDYVDIQVRMLEKMYQKRLKGYAAMGYKAKGEDIGGSASLDIIFDKDSFLPVFSHDITSAKKEILIVTPFVRKQRTARMLEHLKTALENNIRIVIVTRPAADFKPDDRQSLDKALTLLENSGVRIVFQSGIHQKFAIIDQKVVWYGSINLLSYGQAQESIMRLESGNIANELVRMVLSRRSDDRSV
ncbi:MAG: phospholipase D-like domain-containing protein, partial [Thermodesulfobacteriota bacterium]